MHTNKSIRQINSNQNVASRIDLIVSLITRQWIAYHAKGHWRSTTCQDFLHTRSKRGTITSRHRAPAALLRVRSDLSDETAPIKRPSQRNFPSDWWSFTYVATATNSLPHDWRPLHKRVLQNELTWQPSGDFIGWWHVSASFHLSLDDMTVLYTYTCFPLVRRLRLLSQSSPNVSIHLKCSSRPYFVS